MEFEELFISFEEQKEIGGRLKDLRKSKNLSQEELSEEFGCKRETILHNEKGRTILSVERLNQYVKYFDVTADFILYGKKKEDDLEHIVSLLNNVLKDLCEYVKQNNTKDQ